MEIISVASLGAFLLLFIGSTGILCLLTGYTRRSYSSLARSDSVMVAGNEITLEQLAASFQPQLFHKAGDYSPPALTMWWEAIDAGDAVALVYHPVWQDERHPVPFLHWIYYAYRAIVYGVPVRDIEYIQINISRADGLIQHIRYEGSSSATYNDTISEHVYITIDRHGTGYTETATQPKEVPRIRPLQITGSCLQFGIATWGHQFVLLENSAADYTVPVPMPLTHLTEANYMKHKLARRSQGDFVTREGIVGRAATSVIRTMVLGLPYLLSRLRHANAAR